MNKHIPKFDHRVNARSMPYQGHPARPGHRKSDEFVPPMEVGIRPTEDPALSMVGRVLVPETMWLENPSTGELHETHLGRGVDEDGQPYIQALIDVPDNATPEDFGGGIEIKDGVGLLKTRSVSGGELVTEDKSFTIFPPDWTVDLRGNDGELHYARQGDDTPPAELSEEEPIIIDPDHPVEGRRALTHKEAERALTLGPGNFTETASEREITQRKVELAGKAIQEGVRNARSAE
jgi:hypothetical protein